MKIYTRNGDSGETSLFGGKRVWKDDLRIISYGTVDELNSILGAARAEIQNPELKSLLSKIQNTLFTVGADLSTPLDKSGKDFVIPRLDPKYAFELEGIIDKYEAGLPELKNFILPGGIIGSSFLHLARAVCRRAERETVALSRAEEINPEIVVYLNRLSDLLFVLARFENFTNRHPDTIWEK